jgi:hypothetical protein
LPPAVFLDPDHPPEAVQEVGPLLVVQVSVVERGLAPVTGFAESVITGAEPIGAPPVTVIFVPVRAQPVAPFDAVQLLLPLIVAVPLLFPKTVEPLTLAIAGAFEENVPPLQPAGADAVRLFPTVTDPEES